MNRVYVAMQEGVDEPDWFENVEPFVQKALGQLKFDGEEISMLRQIAWALLLDNLMGRLRN